MRNKYYVPLIFSIIYFIVNPVMTEHAEFALTLSGFKYFTDNNWFFKNISSEFSSQITIPAMLLKLGANKFYVQMLMSFISVAIPYFAVWEFCKKFPDSIIFYGLFTTLLALTIIPNWYFYPFSFPAGFFNFGNLGLWSTLLFFGLLINNNKLAYFLYGFLLGWHPSWFLCATLFLAVHHFHNNQIPLKTKLLLILMGILLSLGLFIIYFYLRDELYLFLGITLDQSGSLIKLFGISSIQDNAFTEHNPVIIKDFSFGEFILIFNFLIPALVINYKLEILKNNRYLINFRKSILIFINVNTIFVLTILTYIEFSRLIPLPLTGLLQRLIINRLLDVNLVLIFLYIFALILLELRAGIKSKLTVFLGSVLLWYLMRPNILSMVATFLSFTLYLFFKSNKICNFIEKYRHKQASVCVVAILTIMPIGILFISQDRDIYNAFTFIGISKDPVIDFLEKRGNEEILVAPLVQANRGMNIGLFSNASYFLLNGGMTFDFEGTKKNVFCFDSSKTYLEMVQVSQNCFTERSKLEWQSLLTQLNMETVIVPKELKLNLNLEAQNLLFSVYTK